MEEVCTSFFLGDCADSTNIQVKCRLVLGTAYRTSGPDTPLVETGSELTRPVYMCASTTKATIKSVSFPFNQSRGSGLDTRSVTLMKDKQYASKADIPIWGIETTSMTLSAIDPLWGLIDPDSPDIVNITMIQSPRLYVPAVSSTIRHSTLDLDGGNSYASGATDPAVIWNSAYATRSSLSSDV